MSPIPREFLMFATKWQFDFRRNEAISRGGGMTSTKLRCFNELFLVIDHRRQYKQQHDAYEVSAIRSLSLQSGIRLCF